MKRLLPKSFVLKAGLILLMFWSVSQTALAFKKTHGQHPAGNITVTGTVTDENGDPLPGVTVIIKGTSISTATKNDGKYTITASDKGTLVFRFIGHASQEINIDGRAVIDVKLLTNNRSLEEVVVVGYGTQKKSDVTGAVTSISKDRINNMVRTDVVQLLEGAAAGLNVSATAAGSNPESGTVLLIRGRNSINASTDPLIILDGIPYNGSLSDISPYDIESIEILKDASSTAIYGSRASNGVILIQSKKGVKGKPTVRYNGFYSIQSVANFPDLMNGDQYYQYKKSDTVGATSADILSNSEVAVYQSGSWKSFTWKDLILRNGNSQSHNFSISGGSDKTTYNVSFSYLNTNGITINDQYKRGNARLNLTSGVNNWLTLGTSTMLGRIDNSGATPSFIDVMNKSPLAIPFNPDGSINILPIADSPNKINPLECLLYDDLKLTYSASTNNYANIELPVKGLSYRLNTGLQYQSSQMDWYKGSNTKVGGIVNGLSETDNGQKYSYTVENVLSYQREFKKHNIFLTGLFSIEGKNDQDDILDGQNFANDFLSYYGVGQAALVTPSYEYDKTFLVSQMFRANYSYASKYLLTATVRRDGFSGFGSDRKYGVFPSLALGWNISNEGFFNGEKSIVNNLKLRLSYGDSGNQAIKPYQTLSQLGGGNYIDNTTKAPGYIPETLGTPSLGWETTRALNLGLDFGLLNSRITGEIDVYRNNTSDLLLKRSISPINGINTIFQNIGKTQNEGIEFTLNSTNISAGKFSWNMNLNFAYIKTKIVDLYGNGLDDIANSWFLGQPIKENYDYKFIGVWQVSEAAQAAKYGAIPGYPKYQDLNGNGVIDPGDRQLLGNQEPNFTYGFTNNFKYKAFGLSVFLYGKMGAQKSNPFYNTNYLINHNFWTPDNPTNEYWSASPQATRYLGKGISPSIYQNANFMRIKDITLTYSVPARLISKIGLGTVDLFLTGKNLMTFTSWTGLDPELDTQSAIPLQREYIIGLNVRF